ncbi:MAG: glycosyltransferase family 9 protein [Proteobacteria bacterium]|nr:glycosyltransferase family 9 protein [Pseudomonadota bacterium]MDA1022230.1 glycosyltransferase family 9 protein [Pseudomonadota bacterium]
MPDIAPPGILVIKLGALGDFVQAFGAFAAIRKHHDKQKITLLTTPPFGEFAKASGYFDTVCTDGRPATLDIAGWLRLRHFLRGGGYGRVYDLQTSGRSSFYYRLFWPGPRREWSGIAKGCSHPHANPERDRMHTVERQAEQLSMAGIKEITPPDLGWATADISGFGLSERYALLAPGGAAHRPGKRWPAGRFGELAQILTGKNIQPVLVGATDEAPMMAAICDICPDALGLAGKTTLLDLAALGRGAVLCVGNDTGPMHLLSAVGCRSVVVYSDQSDPALCGQRGRDVTILRRDALSSLAVSDVVDALGV